MQRGKWWKSLFLTDFRLEYEFALAAVASLILKFRDTDVRNIRFFMIDVVRWRIVGPESKYYFVSRSCHRLNAEISSQDNGFGGCCSLTRRFTSNDFIGYRRKQIRLHNAIHTLYHLNFIDMKDETDKGISRVIDVVRLIQFHYVPNIRWLPVLPPSHILELSIDMSLNQLTWVKVIRTNSWAEDNFIIFRSIRYSLIHSCELNWYWRRSMIVVDLQKKNGSKFKIVRATFICIISQFSRIQQMKNATRVFMVGFSFWPHAWFHDTRPTRRPTGIFKGRQHRRLVLPYKPHPRCSSAAQWSFSELWIMDHWSQCVLNRWQWHFVRKVLDG